VTSSLPPLFHYTCDHGHQGIGEGPAGILLPNDGLVWLTDLESPVREALGLTSHTLSCDRTQYRYRATAALAHVRPWTEARRQVRREVREALEAAPGAMPMHWWVSAWPVLVTYAPQGVTSRDDR
jgi:hypothetical protein